MPGNRTHCGAAFRRQRRVTGDGQGRDLPFFASFEAEPDLAARAEEILAAELDR